jgi:hypothetical protein
MTSKNEKRDIVENSIESSRVRTKPDPKPIEWFRENSIPIAGVIFLSLIFCLLFHYQGHTDRTRAKDLAEILNHVVQSVAIIAGGVWAIFTFSKGRQFQESLVVSISGKIVVIDGQTYISAKTNIQNIGTSKIVFNFKSCTLLVNEYIKTTDDKVVTVPDILIGNFYALHEKDVYIEPNEIIYGTRLIWIPNPPDIGFRLDFVIISVKKAFKAEEGYTWRTSCIIEKPTPSGNIGVGDCPPKEATTC